MILRAPCLALLAALTSCAGGAAGPPQASEPDEPEDGVEPPVRQTPGRGGTGAATADAAAAAGTDARGVPTVEDPRVGDRSMDGGGAAAVDTAADAPGARASDAGAVTVGMGPPCRGGELVCDDFEAGTLGALPARWQKRDFRSGAAALDGKHTHSGAKALLFSGQGVYAGLEPVGWTTPKGNELYGRMMLYFESMPAGNIPAHFALVRAEGGAWMRFGGSNKPDGNNTFDATYVGSCDVGTGSSVRIPKDRWFCYEWGWNRATGAWSLWVDGQPVKGLNFAKAASASACWGVRPVDRISIGWQQDHRTTGRLAMWVDDVALSQARVGCPAPGGR